jgi:hypothetical protein
MCSMRAWFEYPVPTQKRMSYQCKQVNIPNKEVHDSTFLHIKENALCMTLAQVNKILTVDA